MKVLILGASGNVGRWLTWLAVERGHDVTALLRDSSALAPSPAITVIRGEATDPHALDFVVPGHDAVLCAIGHRRGPLIPWNKRTSPPDLMTRVMSGLIPAMEKHEVRRLVVVSAAGVGATAERCSGAVQQMIEDGTVGVAYRDLAEMERQLEGSGLDWQVVQPVTLREGAPTGEAQPVREFHRFATVRRGDVAKWMIEAAERAARFTTAEHRVMLGA